MKLCVYCIGHIVEYIYSPSLFINFLLLSKEISKYLFETPIINKNITFQYKLTLNTERKQSTCTRLNLMSHISTIRIFMNRESDDKGINGKGRSIIAIGKELKNIRRLTVENCDDFDDKFFIGENFDQLEYLKIVRCYGFNKEGDVKGFECLKKVNELVLDYSEDKNVWVDKLVDKKIAAKVGNAECLKDCLKYFIELKKLTLGCCIFINDSSFDDGLKKLEDLTLYRCDKITNGVFGKLPALKVLTIMSCVGFTMDERLEGLKDRLDKIQVYGCKNLPKTKLDEIFGYRLAQYFPFKDFTFATGGICYRQYHYHEIHVNTTKNTSLDRFALVKRVGYLNKSLEKSTWVSNTNQIVNSTPKNTVVTYEGLDFQTSKPVFIYVADAFTFMNSLPFNRTWSTGGDEVGCVEENKRTAIYKKLKSEYVIFFHGLFRNEKGRMFIVVENCENGKLTSYLKKNEGLEMKKRLEILLDVCKGIKYFCEEKCYCSFDISRILLDKNNNAKIMLDFFRNSCGSYNVGIMNERIFNIMLLCLLLNGIEKKSFDHLKFNKCKKKRLKYRRSIEKLGKKGKDKFLSKLCVRSFNFIFKIDEFEQKLRKDNSIQWDKKGEKRKENYIDIINTIVSEVEKKIQSLKNQLL